MDSMILGRYVSGNSIIHRLDPRSKLLSIFFFILIIELILIKIRENKLMKKINQ